MTKQMKSAGAVVCAGMLAAVCGEPEKTKRYYEAARMKAQ